MFNTYFTLHIPHLFICWNENASQVTTDSNVRLLQFLYVFLVFFSYFRSLFSISRLFFFILSFLNANNFNIYFLNELQITLLKYQFVVLVLTPFWLIENRFWETLLNLMWLLFTTRSNLWACASTLVCVCVSACVYEWANDKNNRYHLYHISQNWKGDNFKRVFFSL